MPSTYNLCFPCNILSPGGHIEAKLMGCKAVDMSYRKNSFKLTDKVTYPLTKHALQSG